MLSKMHVRETTNVQFLKPFLGLMYVINSRSKSIFFYVFCVENNRFMMQASDVDNYFFYLQYPKKTHCIVALYQYKY